MRRLLLVSYGFPPVSRVQSLRAAATARGLAERGWDVHVLTVDNPPTFTFDESLSDRLPDNVTVHSSWSLEPTRIPQAIRALRDRRRERDAQTAPETPPASAERLPAAPADSSPNRSYTSLPRGAVRLIRAGFFPEEKVGWTPWAVRRGLGVHRETPCDLIVSTGPPYTDHVIGRKLARATGLPWVAELMDPIVGCYAFPPATPMHARAFRNLERQVADETAAISIATTPWADALCERHPAARDKIIVCPNGFEPNDFSRPEPAPHDGFLVTYVGTFQLSIRPDTFLDAVQALRADPGFRDELRVRFVGPMDAETDAAIAERGLSDLVERTGLVGHDEAIAQMREADVLLFILGPEEESRGILSGKLPEYLASGSMILGLAPEGVATDAVTRSGAGLCVEPGDVDGTAAALRALYDRWREGQPLRPDPQVVAEFDRRRSLDDLDRVLTSLATSGGWKRGAE